MIELNAAQLHAVNDGMIHQYVAGSGTLVILKDPFAKLGIFVTTCKTGYVAIEDDQIVNEGGTNSENTLKNFHGEVVVI